MRAQFSRTENIESLHTCERCGAPGKLGDGFWQYTYWGNCDSTGKDKHPSVLDRFAGDSERQFRGVSRLHPLLPQRVWRGHSVQPRCMPASGRSTPTCPARRPDVPYWNGALQWSKRVYCASCSGTYSQQFGKNCRIQLH